jgi:N4-gp56 family major capsid protein
MSINNFIPAVWSAQLLSELQKSLVYANLCNRDYEGEISGFGDQVKINSLGAVSVGNYTKNTDIADPETLTDAQRILIIDTAKYFNFQIDDVDKAQQKPKVMGEAMKNAAYALADAADQKIAGLYTGISATNTLGSDTTPKVIDVAAGTGIVPAYETLVDLGTTLTEANVPKQGRWVVLPPWYVGLLQKDTRFVGAGTQKTDDVLANGFIGRAAGFDIFESNNVPNVSGAKYKVIAGYSGALSYAEQIVDVEAYRPEKRFADAVKGLHVYGAKVTRPTGLALLVCSQNS